MDTATTHGTLSSHWSVSHTRSWLVETADWRHTWLLSLGNLARSRGLCCQSWLHGSALTRSRSQLCHVIRWLELSPGQWSWGPNVISLFIKSTFTSINTAIAFEWIELLSLIKPSCYPLIGNYFNHISLTLYLNCFINWVSSYFTCLIASLKMFSYDSIFSFL